MPKIRINISVDEEVSGMLKELAKAWHTTVSQLVTNWTLERHKEVKAWDRLDETLYVPGGLELAVDGYMERHPEADRKAVERNPDLLVELLQGYRCKVESELGEQGLLPANDPDSPTFA